MAHANRSPKRGAFGGRAALNVGRGRTVGLLVLCLSLAAVARDATGAQVRSTQSGTVVLADAQAATGPVPLSTAVDTTKAFLVFGVSEDSFDPRDGQITRQFSSPTTLSLERIGTTGAVTIKWYVVEFDNGVSVQRGTVEISVGNITDVTLPIAVDTARSFPLISYRVEGNFFNCSDFVRAKITSTTNLQLSTDNANCGTNPSLVDWQVVEYADANVRSGDIAFATTDLVQTATLALPENPAKSWLICSYEGTPSVSDLGQFLVRAGRIDEETLQQAAQEARDIRQRTGDVLILMGLITEQERLYYIGQQIKSILYSLFAWEDGFYQLSFQERARKETIKLDLHPATLCLRGVKKLYKPERLARLVRTEDRLMPSGQPPYQLHDIELEKWEASLLAKIDGTRTNSEVYALAARAEHQVSAFLAAMMGLQILERRET
jgi:hypothetical protein